MSKVKVSDVFGDESEMYFKVENVNDNDEVMTLWGIGGFLIDEHHIEHLKNGGSIMFDNGEYNHLIRMRRGTNES